MKQDGEIARLSLLEEWMRERGVTHLRTRDGTELQVGPRPPPASVGSRAPQTEEERSAEQRARAHRIMFASSSVRPKLRSTP